jgi:hypothetical protein
VLKAVRLLGRFSRVHYLLSYDEQTVPLSRSRLSTDPPAGERITIAAGTVDFCRTEYVCKAT